MFPGNKMYHIFPFNEKHHFLCSGNGFNMVFAFFQKKNSDSFIKKLSSYA